LAALVQIPVSADLTVVVMQAVLLPVLVAPVVLPVVAVVPAMCAQELTPLQTV
jgi:hypothetical protein